MGNFTMFVEIIINSHHVSHDLSKHFSIELHIENAEALLKPLVFGRSTKVTGLPAMEAQRPVPTSETIGSGH